MAQFSSLFALNTPELYIRNESVNRNIFVTIYPISFLFNGFNNYDLLARYREDTVYNFINSRVNDRLDHGQSIILNHDRSGATSSNFGAVGYGVYKFEFNGLDGFTFFDTCTVEWDSGWAGAPPPFGADLELIFVDNNNNPRIEFRWAGGDQTRIDDTLINRKIRAWIQPGNGVREKSFGDFTLEVQDTSALYPPLRDYNFYNIIPQCAQYDCARLLYLPNGTQFSRVENNNIGDSRFGNLTQNLHILKDVTARADIWNFAYPIYINLLERTILDIANGKSITMLTNSPPCQVCFTEIIVNDSSILKLGIGSSINIYPPNKLTILYGGHLELASQSIVRIYPGGKFCNFGGSVLGKGYIFYVKGIHNTCEFDNFTASDSAHIVLDSATLSLPDDFTLHLKGSETALVLNPGSKLLFGENSGIVCDSGARIVANYATFASVDSTKKWNGISLNDLASDTIKNCIIKNAMYGVMISDMYDSEESPEQYSAEISGCSFVNQTSQVLNNAVYLQNSAHVLLKNNAITSNNLSIGFTHGIYAEYCPGEMLNIFNNSLSNCNNGMTIIQSSPYIAFNTLNGNSYGESGMFLDNSNGTIKYNVISDFYNSYYSFYSSPDLLKNTFDNSCDDNIYLSSSSVPVMHPLISGGSTYWFAGDNHITGSPYDAGILFDGDAYPDLNYGYNRFTLSGSNFYLSGINPSETSRDFYAVQNYWYDTPPDSSKFNVTNAESVIYSPYDNNSQSARQTNTFDTTDIGFGLKDTIHILESDNPNSAQELFLLAYQSEFNGEYEEAIGYYKEIVSEYKDSSNASSCLARIFNCYEKKQATVTEYTLLESYYSAISDDTTQSVIMRNISEDLAIQSNIKQGNIEEAISDYDEIYASNTNTPKGFHALINKEILSAGSGDNMSSGNSVEEIEFKQIKINALLKGLDGRDANAMMSTNSITLDFNLLQNYPNPFNPRTIINYELRIKNFIVLKVYDIAGREVATLVNEIMPAGKHAVEFNAIGLSSGVYFYSLNVEGKQMAVKRMALVK
jgi:tetratricopeptide (TPR) repeat protein